MSSNDYATRILKFVSEAGDISLKVSNRYSATLKQDNSVITVADEKISQLCYGHLGDLFERPDHLMIDEESENVVDLLDQQRLDQATYIWSLDPIDGTRVYANGMPQFGVSIGLIKDLKPWMGAVFFPQLGELFFCDGTEAYFASQAFTPNEQRRMIEPIEQEINAHSILMCDDDVFKYYDWDYKDAQVVISGAAAIDLTWPTIGRGCGCIFCSSLWDYAGAWPIIQAAGMQLRHIETGEVLDTLRADLFRREPQPWKVRDYYVLSTEKNYPIIKSKLIKR